MLLVLDPEKRGCHWQGLRYGAVGSSRHWKRADALNASVSWNFVHLIHYRTLGKWIRRIPREGQPDMLAKLTRHTMQVKYHRKGYSLICLRDLINKE